MRRPKTIDLTPLIFQKRFVIIPSTRERVWAFAKRHAFICSVVLVLLLSVTLYYTTSWAFKMKSHYEQQAHVQDVRTYELETQVATLLNGQKYNPSDLVSLANTISTILDTADNEAQHDFLQKALPQAIRIQLKYNFPASAVLAQSIYESNYGQSKLAKDANNYFGIKALDASWSGEVYNTSTLDYDKTVKRIQPFRKYATLYDGYEGYVQFIKGNSRYDNAFRYTNNGQRFISALLTAGYCPDSFYARDIANIFERHKLKQLDAAIQRQLDYALSIK